MRLWPALLVPPLAFLTLMTVAYALEPVACESQWRFGLHAAALASVAIAAAGIALAWRDWRSAGLKEPDDSAEEVVRVRFISVMGLLISGFMTLTSLTMWIAIVVIPPCVR